MLYDVAVGGLKQRHPNTAQGVKGAERKWSRLAAEEMRTIVEWYLQAYGLLLTLVSLFKYLGKVLIASDNYWPVLVVNLSK